MQPEPLIRALQAMRCQTASQEKKANTYPSRVSSLSWMDPSCMFWARAVRGSFFCGTEGTELSLVLLTLSSFPSTSPRRFCCSSIWFLLHKHSSFLDSKKMPSHKKFQAPRLLLSDTLRSTFFSALVEWWPKANLNYCQGEINSFKLRFKQAACHISLPVCPCSQVCVAQ